MRIFKYFNIFLVFILFIATLLFIFYFSINEELIDRDISKSQIPSAAILIEKEFRDSKIILFSVGKNKTGIANYIKLPFLNKYYCQDLYVLKNLEDQSQEINDVFKGTWNGYVITATPKHIKLENTAKSYGLYWDLIYILMTLLYFEWIIYMLIKRKSKKVGKKT